MPSSKWLIPISCIPEFIVTGYAIAIYGKLRNELRLFCWFIFLSCAVELATILLWWFHKNNLPLHHFYVPAGFFILLWFFKSILRNYIDPRIFNVVIVLFLAFSIINSFFIQDIFTFDSNALTVESVLVIILSFFTLNIAQNEAVKEVADGKFKSINWINAGLLIYFSSNLLLFYFGDIINRSFPIYLSQYSWYVHGFFSLVMYTSFFIGLWKRPTT